MPLERLRAVAARNDGAPSPAKAESGNTICVGGPHH